MSRRQWTTKEIEFLKEKYDDYTAREIARMLNRTYISVVRKIQTLGLKKKKSLFIVYQNDKVIAMGTIDEVAKRTGLKKSTVRRYALPSWRKNLTDKINHKYAIRLRK